MPVVTFRRQDLCHMIGHDVPMDELADRMPMIGGDLDKIDGDDITIEWFPDRPDLLTLEGTGRALAAFMGDRQGMPKYDIQASNTTLTVDDSVAAVRPYAGLCFVRGVDIDDDYLELIIQAQEKFCLAPGRKRRKIAIGIHDANDVQGPFSYTCVGSDEKPFVPLAWETPLTPAQIMEQHPKGQEYGHLLPEGKYPVFLDGNGDVLSLPPVINAAKTTVTTATKDLLIDVTGTDPHSVRATIALLATGFADRGGSIEAVEVHDASGTWVCPDLKPAEHVVHEDDVRKLLGIDLDGPGIAGALAKMGHDAEAFDNKILVQTPAWRMDILHTVDLIEDVAIGHGFENFPGSLPEAITFGGALPHQELDDDVRRILTGLGWSEARTLTLSNDADQWTKWGMEPAPAARIANSVLEDQTLLRQRIVPGLLGVLSANRHRPLPQRIFEVGETVVDVDGAWRNRLRLGIVESAAKTGFSEAKGLAEALIRDLRLDAILEPADEPGFIPGRQGRICLDGRSVGHFGELHPDTIVAFGLGSATIAIEVDLHGLQG